MWLYATNYNLYCAFLKLVICADDHIDNVPKHGRPPTEEELHQFFLPFRGFCARKGVSINLV